MPQLRLRHVGRSKVRYVAKTPSIGGPFEEDVMPNGLLTCGIEECELGVCWRYGYRLEAEGKRMSNC